MSATNKDIKQIKDACSKHKCKKHAQVISESGVCECCKYKCH